MAKRKKPRYYVAQVGTQTNFNWSIPENNSPSVVNQTATGATDAYGNTYFKQDNTGAPTFEGDVTGTPKSKFDLWSLFGNTNKTELAPAIQGLNAGMQAVTGVASMINEVNNKKDEKDQNLRAITPDYYENMEGYGLNANPVFTKYGGGTHGKYQTGGVATRQRYTLPDNMSAPSTGSEINWQSRNIRSAGIEKDARLADDISSLLGNAYDPYQGPGRGILTSLKNVDQPFVDELGIRLKKIQQLPNYATMTPEDRINTFYSSGVAGKTAVDQFIQRARTLGGSPAAFWQNNASNTNRPGLQTGGEVNWTSRNILNAGIDKDALLADRLLGIIGNDLDPYTKGKGYLNSINDEDLANQAAVRITQLRKQPGYAQMTPEQRITTFYNATGDTSLDQFLKRTKTLGGSPATYWQNHPGNTRRTGVMQTGGSIPKTYGLQKGGAAMANVEAEQGEAIQYNDGSIGQIADDANTHDEGGVLLPQVHRVLENTSNIRKDKTSKMLKLTPEDVEHATGAKVKGNMSHAEALVKANDYFDKERNKITKKVELAARDREQLDKYGELSTKLNMDQFAALPSKEQLFEQLFNNQELVKAMNGIPTGGTTSKYGGGLSREEDYGSKSKPYASVAASDFAGGGRSYPIPTKADAEDALRLAHLHGRSDVIAKVHAKYPELKQYGGTAKKMQLAGYSGSKTGQKTPKGNPDSFSGNFDDYLKDLKDKGFNYEGITSNSDLQTALYDYKLKNKEYDDIKNMWGEGIHNKGMAEARKLGFVDDKGLFKPGVLDDPKNLEKLASLYPDNMLGPRTLRVSKGKTPPRIWVDDEVPADVVTPEQNLDTSITPATILEQPRSRFNEPLRWFDTASATNAYIAALEREPGNYNPAEFNQLRYKLQDPTAALQQNQADFNAAVQATQSMAPNNPGAAAANVANLAASKYAANNQIMGQYENANAQIKNNEITYNTQVRDKNSLADQQAREVFENKVLTSKAIQQEQKLTALDSLYKTIAENRALNRNGNLVMKFSRAFDQYGDFNGYRHIFGVNPALGIPNTPTTTGNTGAAGGVQQLAPGKNYYNRKTGKTLYFDGTKLVERK